jgi:hypothetical protein
MLIMPGTTTRAAALGAGRLDAAVLMREEYIDLAGRMPERIGFVEDLGRRWGLAAAGLNVNAQFARAQPEAVDHLVAEYLSAVGTVIGDADRLAMAAADILGDDRDWRRASEAFIAANTWPADGGLEPVVVRETIAFHVRAGSLPAGAEPSRLVDRSFLDRTLRRGVRPSVPPSP